MGFLELLKRSPVTQRAEQHVSEDPANHEGDVQQRNLPEVLANQVPLWTPEKSTNSDKISLKRSVYLLKFTYTNRVLYKGH